MAEFLAEHQTIAAPIIEWGGLFLLLFVILSPFLIIRHRYFKPTRWWHVVGAYFSSFLILFLIEWLLGKIDQWLIQNYLNTVDLYRAYDSATFRRFLWLIALYPLLIFYGQYLLFGRLNLKKIVLGFIFALFMLFVLLIAGFHLMIYGLGQASMNF